MTDIANALSQIDGVRLISHGDLGLPEPEGENVVSFAKARRERVARLNTQIRARLRDYDDAR